ncbi:MAG: signal peptide peptidase SppA [Bacteroidota bacterium]
MKNFLSSLLATIIGILIMTIVVILIFVGIIAASTSKEIPEVKENSILLAKFNAQIIDRTNEDPFANLFSGNFMYDKIMGLNQILKDLDKAENDENVKGIFLNLGGISAGIATLGEIREALQDFKENSGKFIYAYADAYTQKSYYLASVADSIFMTPEGMFLFNGMRAEVMFYKNALDKIGVEMQVVRHGTYKGAVEPFLRDDLSKENREQIESYVGALWGKIVEDISESRSISTEELNQIADDLVTIDPDQLLETGMIDGLIYYEEMLTLMKSKMGVEEEDDLEAISLKSYKDVPATEKKEYSKDKVAVIYAMGSVVDGSAGEGFIGSERIAKAIRKARRDKSVKAIVFRINSGGGSGSASDVIHHEVMLAAKEKPVVASMGDVAASGGYYIAAPADTILAGAGTITGSIGVFGLFPNMQELMNEKLGISTDVVKTNTHADIFTAMDPLDPGERLILQKMVDDFYNRFVTIVAEGRGKSYEEVDAIAGGRVWAGSDALDLGLIDMYGGLEKAIEVAAEMAGLENYRVRSLPTLEDPLTVIMKQLTGEAMMRSDRIVRRELGDQYIHYRKIRDISKMQGIQAIIPFEIEVH